MNNKGSTMVLLVIVIALVIILGTSVLSISVKQYEIKKVNIDSKQCFYMSETGLNEAYVESCILIDKAIAKALQIAEDYLSNYPLNSNEAEDIFIENYTIHLSSNIKAKIEAAANPSVAVWNDGALKFEDGLLTLILKSKYINENNVDRITGVEIVIGVPKFGDVKAGAYNVRNYIDFQNWNS